MIKTLVLASAAAAFVATPAAAHDRRYQHRHNNDTGKVIAGVALGTVLGAVIAGGNRDRNYGYGYNDPYQGYNNYPAYGYGQPYGYAQPYGYGYPQNRVVVYYYPGYTYRNGYYYDNNRRRYDGRWMYQRYGTGHRYGGRHHDRRDDRRYYRHDRRR